VAITIQAIETYLVGNGFTARSDTNKKYKELVHIASGERVYLNKAEPKVYSQLIVHPRHLNQRNRLLGLGHGIGSSQEKRFGSNLREFPKEMRNGSTACNYGVPFGFDSVTSLSVFVKDRFG
jgi:hypothetical protein